MNRIYQLSLTMMLCLLLPAMAAAKCQLVVNVHGQTPAKDSQKLQSFNWLAFDSGKVIAIGTQQPGDQSLAPYTDCDKRDGKGHYLLPGLIDAHGHMLGLGTEMIRVNLRGVTSENAAAEMVKAFAAQNTQSNWILGRGWNQVLWLNKQFPDKASLDTTGIKKPIVLRRVDGHALWANSIALQIAGVNRDTPDPAGGKIERDENGEPSGVLVDNAMALVESKIPPMSSMELEYAFDKAYQYLLSLGIVGVHDAGIDQSEINSYKERAAAHKLPIRIYAMLNGASPNLMKWLNEGYISDDKDFLSIRSVKLYSDGALGSRGAALLAPYSDDIDNKGLLLTASDKLDNLVETILAKKFQVNVHAIGDRGNRNVLDAYEKAFKKVGGQELRNRVEHAQVISLADIPRFKTLGIVASMQPVHATSDKNMAGDRLGNERLKGAYAWQKLIQQGTIIASGSDFPVELANPFDGLHAAITRQDHDNQPQGGWLPGEKMTPAQALRSFTLDAAYAAHQEEKLGSLEQGKWADFILVNQDVIDGNPETIWKTQVLQTWVGGELKYEKQ